MGEVSAVGHRLTIRSIGDDPRVADLVRAATALGVPLDRDRTAIADVILVDGPLDADDRMRLHSFLVDPLLQHGSWEPPTTHGIEVAVHPGVTDVAAGALRHAAEQLSIPVHRAATARRIELDPDLADDDVDRLVRRVVANPVTERWAVGCIAPAWSSGGDVDGRAEVVAVRGLGRDALLHLGAERSLALDPEELEVICDHFTAEGRDPTDVELETLAQTWSEHCAHKTFRAEISTDDGEDRPSLLAMLRDCTDAIDAPYVRSAFVGNAGIVSYDHGVTIALKAETHNHPSAVEPFGGANTGVGGVIRDILGAAHRPVAVTDILCFGPPDTDVDQVPEGALHPLRIRDGVIDGVADYGNKLGLPTVAGAVLYDPAYTTNPLVFAGCIGVADERPLPAGPFPGDRVVVIGGRTGRDGIRGATFSSATMDATTGEVAGASVQIGDPVTEKLVIDALVGAEDLYTAITDCGAGGLSSAIGEMAEGVGADVDLRLVPLKYEGLESWEIWLSEAQERMVVAVEPTRLAELSDRCEYYGVELTDLGQFTGDRRLVVRHGDHVVLDLDVGFLHDGRPRRHLEATMPTPVRDEWVTRTVDDPAATILGLLSHRNIASKSEVIRRYDHEIGGGTVIRPIVGPQRDGPGDGVVLAEPTHSNGLAIGIGVNPWYGLHDPEAMAYAAVDEAIRNVVAVGGDPDRVSLLDNFSWGDPRRPSTLGDLVAAVDGCCAASMAFRAPFVSGKDSLNNEYVGNDGERHAVPPTLVITAVAPVDDVAHTVTSDLVEPGDVVVLVGATATEFAGSHLDLVAGPPTDVGVAPAPDPDAPERYRTVHRCIGDGLVHACHDVSEGGLAVALAEMCIGGRLGLEITELPHDDHAVALFAESTGRLLLEVAPDDVAEVVGRFEDARVLGHVVDDDRLVLPGVEPIELDALVDAFHRHPALLPPTDDDREATP